MKHIIDLSDLTRGEIENLVKNAQEIIAHTDDYRDSCKGKVMASLFFEPSTRTCFSFQTAMMRLGGSVFGFSDPTLSSVSKGESLSDTVVMCSGYADVLVMRHPQEGAAKAASLYSDVSVINAGDGGHLHPTQTLTDITTMFHYRGSCDAMRIGLCGDLLNGRTVHSLIKTLSKFKDVTFYLISPPELRIPAYLRSFMMTNHMKFYETSSMESVIQLLDVLYMTRIQKERFSDILEYEKLKGVYILSKRKLRNAKKDMIIMHPLPRVDEITVDVDSDPRAVYFQQARLGMFARMALLLRQISFGREPFQVTESNTTHRCKNPKCILSKEKNLPLVESMGRCIYCDSELS